jgi:hypothetical protein
MLSLDRDGVVVYASSFSKTVCPGIADALSDRGDGQRRDSAGRVEPRCE